MPRSERWGDQVGDGGHPAGGHQFPQSPAVVNASDHQISLLCGEGLCGHAGDRVVDDAGPVVGGERPV